MFPSAGNTKSPERWKGQSTCPWNSQYDRNVDCSHTGNRRTPLLSLPPGDLQCKCPYLDSESKPWSALLSISHKGCLQYCGFHVVNTMQTNHEFAANGRLHVNSSPPPADSPSFFRLQVFPWFIPWRKWGVVHTYSAHRRRLIASKASRQWRTANSMPVATISTSNISAALMVRVQGDLPSISRAARRRRTASSMPRMAWLTSAAIVAYIARARRHRLSMSRAAKRRFTVSNTLKTAWSTFTPSAAYTNPARGSLPLMSRAARRQYTASNMRRTAWSRSSRTIACMTPAQRQLHSTSGTARQ